MREYGPKRVTINERERNVMPLSEASLNQMMEHGKTGMAIISSQVTEIDRNDPRLSIRDIFERWAGKNEGGVDSIDSDAMYDVERKFIREYNRAADKDLKRDIQAAGFSYTPVFGGYRMQETGEETHEPSYVVYAYDRKGQPVDFQTLTDFALKMCLKYRQESVYVQEPGKPPVYLDCDGNQLNTSSSDRFKFNREGETYFTTTSRDKGSRQRFTADIVFESMYIQLRPGDLNENMRRRKSGEFIL